MSRYSKLTLSPEFDLLVGRYQQTRGLKTKTAALSELVARGWSDWIGELDARGENTVVACWMQDEAAEAALFAEYDADDSASPSFAVWFARRFAPKHGGDRKSAKAKVNTDA